MYRIYKELVVNGKVVHKTPIARCGNLKTAQTHARVWANGHPMGIYKINPDGTESKVN